MISHLFHLNLYLPFFHSRCLLNPRRSAVLRTQWRPSGWTTKGLLVPTLSPRRTCRRTWSRPNTSFCECRSSWIWQRRCVAGVTLYIQLPSNCWVKETVDAFSFSIVNVICLFVVCRSWRRSSSKLRPIATWRKSWPRRMSRSKILGNDCRGECSSSNPIAVIHFSLVSFCQTTQVKTGRVFQGFCFCFCYVTTMCLDVLIRLGTKNTWFWSGTHHGLASKICYGRHKTAGNVCRSP